MSELNWNLDLIHESTAFEELMARGPSQKTAGAQSDKRFHLARRIHEGLLLIQRRNRRLRTEMPFLLPVYDNIIFTFLSHNLELSATEVVSEWGLSKPTVSRIFNNFIEAGYLTTTRMPGDQRIKRYSLTPKGDELIKQLDEFNTKIILRSTAAITASERSRLAAYFRHLNDGLGISPEGIRPSEDPLIVELFRISRGTGIYGNNYMTTGHEIAAYQLLYELYRNSSIEDFSIIKESVPVSISKLSRIISNFEKEGLVTKSAPESDRRRMYTALTEKGRKFFHDHHSRIAREYEEALLQLSLERLDDFIELIDRVVTHAVSPEAPTKYESVIIETEQQRKQARAFLVEQLVRRNNHHELEAEILPADNLCALVVSDQTIRALLEFRRVSAEHYRLSTFETKDDSVKDAELMAAIKSTISGIKKKLRVRRLSVEPGLPNDLRQLAVSSS